MFNTLLRIVTVLLVLVATTQQVCAAKADAITFQIRGVDKDAQANISQRLGQLRKQYKDKLTNTDLKEIQLQIPKEVKKAMQPFAYFYPKTRVNRQKHKNTLVMLITIKPGPELKIRNLSLQVSGYGKSEPEFQEVLHSTKLALNKALRISEYNKTKLAFFHIAEKLGYVKAKMVNNEIKIDLKHYHADVILHFDTGHRYYFGDISFEPNPLRSDFLQRYVLFKAGAPYSTQQLLQLQDTLRSSRYFSNVKITPLMNKTKNYKIPLRVNVEPAKTQIYNIGFGYGTDTSVRTTFEWEKSRLNSLGHRFQTRLQASPKQSSLTARYIIPAAYPPTDEYQLFLTGIRQRLEQNDSLAMLSGISYVSRIGEWRRSININYLYERKHAIDEFESLTSHWLYPSIEFRKVHAKDPINTKRGYNISLQLLGAHDTLFAHESFYQIKLETKHIYTFKDKLRLISRGTLGYIGINDLNQLAANLIFYAGGTKSVRGYKYQSLGPGRYLTVGSLELQYKVYKQWSVAAYFDVGNASNHFRDPLKRSVGIGLVRETLIGSVEIGVARPLDARNKNVNLVVSLGPDLA